MFATRIVIVSIFLVAPQLAFAQEPTILKHDGWVAAVAFAPDGKTLASAGADNVVRLWEVGTWKAKGVLKGHTDCVSAVVFTENWIVTGSFDRSAKAWPLREPKARLFKTKEEKSWTIEDTAREVRTSKGYSFGGCLTAVAAIELFGLPFLIAGSVDGTVNLGGFQKTDETWSYRHKSWVNGVAFNGRVVKDKSAFASASSDGTVGLHTESSNEMKTTLLEGGAGEVRCVAFSPDGKMLAAGNRYGTVRVWDVASRKEIKTITGHMGEVWAIAFSPDGKTLAAVDTEWRKPSKIKLYDTATWKERGSLPCPGEILCLAYSPKGDWLAAGSWDKTVRLFPIDGDKKEKADNPTITDSVGIKLVRIRKGEFTMGSEELPSELPIHKVRLTKDFYLAAHPLTFGQFKAFVKDTGYKTHAEKGKGALGFDSETRWFSSKGAYTWQKPGFEQADDHPVVCVNWHDADAFCKWLTKKEGKTYRLPTEAEFEYAARAGTTTRFSCGEADESLKEYANLADAALLTKMDKKIEMQAAPKGNKSGGIAAWNDGFAFTSPVGKFKSNPWGLHDMHGNVWTWCNDWSVNRYQPGAQDDPTGPAEATKGKVIRGGSWWIGPLRCRSANRVQREPDASFCYVGIRVARAVE